MAEYKVLDTLDMGDKVYAAGATVTIADETVATRLIDLGVIEGDAANAKLSQLTKAQLLELAQQGGLIAVSDAMTKAAIIAAIEEAAATQGGAE